MKTLSRAVPVTTTENRGNGGYRTDNMLGEVWELGADITIGTGTVAVDCREICGGSSVIEEDEAEDEDGAVV